MVQYCRKIFHLLPLKNGETKITVRLNQTSKAKKHILFAYEIIIKTGKCIHLSCDGNMFSEDDPGESVRSDTNRQRIFMMVRPELSVVVLCYKAGESARYFAEKVCHALLAHGIDDYELVLVGNYHPGANDVTPDVVSELAKSNPRIVSVTRPKEGMMGWDMKTGLGMARGHYVAVIDGDGQMPVNDLIRVYREIQEKHFDLVMTYRIVRGDGQVRKVLSLLYNTLFKMFFPGLYVRDVNAKPKIFTREALEMLKLRSDDWFIDAEMMIQARRYGFKIGEIPTHFLGLKGSRRSFINVVTVFEFVINLFVFRVREFFISKS